jgi:hypothetical protein
MRDFGSLILGKYCIFVCGSLFGGIKLIAVFFSGCTFVDKLLVLASTIQFFLLVGVTDPGNSGAFIFESWNYMGIFTFSNAHNFVKNLV